jgi:hypothetical protein
VTFAGTVQSQEVELVKVRVTFPPEVEDVGAQAAAFAGEILMKVHAMRARRVSAMLRDLFNAPISKILLGGGFNEQSALGQ